MVLGYHVVLGMYGFWLPNDPRGSGSNFVWSEDLRKFGPATKLVTRDVSRAKIPHDHALRLAAKEALKYPPAILDEDQRRILATGIAEGAAVKQRPIWACALMPDHVHLVLARADERIEQTLAWIKRRGTWELTRTRRHPLALHRVEGKRLQSPWGRGFWKVYLNTDEDIERAIHYVNQNPERAKLPRQSWEFVVRPEL